MITAVSPGVTEKWDLYVRGFELATGYSELVDPVIQRERFVDQARLAAAGDDEAMVLDEDFLAAMEQGMPPTTGTGMGIDRLLMRSPDWESGKPSCFQLSGPPPGNSSHTYLESVLPLSNSHVLLCA